MLADAFLTVAAPAEHTRQPPPGQVPLTRNEIARLFTTLIIQPATNPQAPAALVQMETPPPASRPKMPLPATRPGMTHVTI
jgi:hypothetical protein